MYELVHNYIRGNTAVNIAQSVENAVRSGKILSGNKLPTVRKLADKLGVSPATVSAAYRILQSRGVILSQGRRGTRISYRPVHRCRAKCCIPKNARNLYDGNPDPALLPDLSPALQRIDSSPRLYGQSQHESDFIKLAAKDMKRCGIAVGEMCVVSGAMDGMERVLSEHTKPGDRVIVEDPGFTNIYDLVTSRGLSLIPVAIDDEGMLPDELEYACIEGAMAMIITPRAQNPTGAILSEQRSKDLRKVLRKYPDLLIIEDDHASMITDAPLHSLHDEKRTRWVYMRSFSKALNPDLRLAVMTGDETTMTRVLDRLIIGERWVSHILQRIVFAMLSDVDVRKQLRNAAKTYTHRRNTMVNALTDAGFHAMGASGYNVWMEVEDEIATVQAMQDAGWAIAGGQRFRLNSPPGVRITTATLEPEESYRFVENLIAATERVPRIMLA